MARANSNNSIVSIKNFNQNNFKIVAELMASNFYAGKLLLACGNGGSAAQAQHFVTELVGSCYGNHTPFPAICLNSDSVLLTALSNDFGYENVFVRQLDAFATNSFAIVGFSTSGKSKNIIRLFEHAKYNYPHILRISFVGTNENSELEPLSDHAFRVESTNTQFIQEVHNVLIHLLVKFIVENYNTKYDKLRSS